MAWTSSLESDVHGEVLNDPDDLLLCEGPAFARMHLDGSAIRQSHGFVAGDRRYLKRFQLIVNRQLPTHIKREPIDDSDEKFAHRFVSRAQADPSTSTGYELEIVLERRVAIGALDHLTITNDSTDTVPLTVGFEIDVDFAHLFQVKEGVTPRRVPQHVVLSDTRKEILISQEDPINRGVRICFSAPVSFSKGVVTFDPVQLKPGEKWSAKTLIAPVGVEPSFSLDGDVAESAPAVNQRGWRLNTARLESDNPCLDHAFRVGVNNLGALLRKDQPGSGYPWPAAGAPWFMTLFGRDALITSYMALIANSDTAIGSLYALAQSQGRISDPASEQEVGKILHEIRIHDSMPEPYYGSVDATPLFVWLAGEAWRWGALRSADLKRLAPHIDSALQYIDSQRQTDLEGGGRGYLSYIRSSEFRPDGKSSGLQNQGWKDSWDSISFANGELAEAPLALCEVQGYAYAAYLAGAEIAAAQGRMDVARHRLDQALELKKQFNADFRMDQGWLALGLDANNRRIDSLTSNMGHCLWSGIVDDDIAGHVASALADVDEPDPQMFTGWGLRTLARTMKRYTPLSYHNGSVWPHDTAIGAAGLMRYGFVHRAQRVIMALVDAANNVEGPLPELFGGFDRRDVSAVIDYPAACKPQAWDAATPLELTRTIAGLHPNIPQGRVYVDPHLPEEVGRIHLLSVPIQGSRVSVEIEGDSVRIDGLHRGIEMIQGTPPAPGSPEYLEALLSTPTLVPRSDLAFLPQFEVAGPTV